MNIHDAVDADLPALAIDYRTLGYEVVNNGHTMQVNVAPGSSLTLNGVLYELKQLHFHTPSENEVDERHYAMEAHLVHGDTAGHLAVIGVLFREGPEDSAIARVWAESPKSAGPARTLSAPVDPDTLLPKGRDYYTFEGSLTTPPCTEGVRWIVLKELAHGLQGRGCLPGAGDAWAQQPASPGAACAGGITLTSANPAFMPGRSCAESGVIALLVPGSRA